MKDKQISTRNAEFAKGGSNSMFGKSGVVAQKPGVTANTRGAGNSSIKVSGGSTRMFGQQSVKAAKPV